ncbi:MAG: ATP-dependent DNA helicase [Natronomonas sp.]|uniref:ATP-dependent DNA helicase n=1 Tax=Natronomonas sp. TaxID=2184060 RepID=UPI00287091CD|nr:ATP-dependent DNA helicase [Natronomonas sp.]MDR9430461.1 ATP-dependent DNA helicase [Natronomonas sp.]
MDASRIAAEFPAPSFRGAQEKALSDIRDAFEAGNDVVLVRAPTGSGKSLLARAIAGCARRDGEDAPSLPTGAYYTTPQVSQLDDVAGDELLEDLNIVRGKSNYSCILPGDTSTPVNRAPCARERGFNCPVTHRCPYFADRATASNGSIAAMTLAYFMQTAGSEVFGERDVVVIDEAHGLSEWAEMYATIELSPATVPVWGSHRPPEIEDVSDVEPYAETLIDACGRRQEELRGRVELSESEAEERDRLAELIRDLGWFLEDLRDTDSPTVWVADQSERGTREDPRGGAVQIKPLDPARYLHHTVWNRGTKFALLSATMLDKKAFCRGAGLDPATVTMVDVPHTFPVENRPLYDVTRGKMTYEHRDETLPKVARTIVRLMAKHDDEKGLIHAHSYAIAERLFELLEEFGVGDRIRRHDTENRDAALSGWKRDGDPDVFISVKMEEALDLRGDLCRWQVLCKAPYPNTNDSRVARRLEDGQWGWYYRAALRTVIQACGRVVRAPDDYGATYLADSSLLDLFDRARTDMPPWFEAQVDRLEAPDLPPFDPALALGDADRTNRGRRRSNATRNIDDHPLSDVWGDG